MGNDSPYNRTLERKGKIVSQNKTSAFAMVIMGAGNDVLNFVPICVGTFAEYNDYVKNGRERLLDYCRNQSTFSRMVSVDVRVYEMPWTTSFIQYSLLRLFERKDFT